MSILAQDEFLSGPRPAGRRALVIAGCVAGVLLFLGATAILFTTWARNDSPSCLLTVTASEIFDNAEVTLSPISGVMREPLIAKVSEGEDNQLRFHVPPGSYRISVRNDRGKVLFAPTQCELKPEEPVFITLQDPAISQPTTR